MIKYHLLDNLHKMGGCCPYVQVQNSIACDSTYILNIQQIKNPFFSLKSLSVYPRCISVMAHVSGILIFPFGRPCCFLFEERFLHIQLFMLNFNLR